MAWLFSPSIPAAILLLATASGTVVIGQSTETDTAQPMTVVSGAVSVTVGQTTETDTAQTLTAVIDLLPRTDLLGASVELSSGVALTFTSGSFVPPNNSLLTVSVSAINGSGGGDVRTGMVLTGGGLTWTLRGGPNGATVAGYTGVHEMWTAPVTTGASMTLQYAKSAAVVGSDRAVAVFAVSAFQNYDTSSPIGTTASGTALGEAAASITLGAAPATSSKVLASRGTGPNGFADVHATPGTGWTEIYDVLSATGGYGSLQSEDRTGSTSTDVHWNDMAVEAETLWMSSGLAIEIKASSGGISQAILQATETDTAQTLAVVAGGVSITIGQVTETDTAQAVSALRSIAVTIGQATEADTAQPLTAVAGAVSVIVGQAAETDTAGALTVVAGALTVTVGQAVESDTAQAVAVLLGQTVVIGQVVESDTAQAVSIVPGAVSIVIGSVTETDTAQAVTAVTGAGVVVIGSVAETDTAQTLSAIPGGVSVTIGQALETDSASAMTVVVGGAPATVLIGIATEVDEAMTLVAIIAPPGIDRGGGWSPARKKRVKAKVRRQDVADVIEIVVANADDTIPAHTIEQFLREELARRNIAVKARYNQTVFQELRRARRDGVDTIALMDDEEAAIIAVLLE